MDGAIKNISKGNFSAAISEIESVKTLISKGNKLIRFAYKNPAGWTAVEEYASEEPTEDSDDQPYRYRRDTGEIQERKRSSLSARPSYTSTRQPSSEGASAGPFNTLGQGL